MIVIEETEIETIKNSCMVLGLRKKGNKFPDEIHGTCFTVDPEGFVVTADHVIVGIIDKLKELNKENEDYEMCASFLTYNEDNTATITTTPVKERMSLIIKVEELGDYLPQDHDIAICRIFGKWGNLPFIKIQKPSRLKILQEICICGYPRGEGTLNVFDKRFGIRSSPIIQFGKISSLMPNDKTKRPTGIITDIIGVGGSSGSPIINAETGEVLGIAQHVIPASVLDRSLVPIGTTNMGLTWGITLYFLQEGIYRMIETMKKEVDENGEPIDKIKKVFKLEFTAGEAGYTDFDK